MWKNQNLRELFFFEIEIVVLIVIEYHGASYALALQIFVMLVGVVESIELFEQEKEYLSYWIASTVLIEFESSEIELELDSSVTDSLRQKKI